MTVEAPQTTSDSPHSDLPGLDELARLPAERLEAGLVGAAASEAAAKARFLVLLGEFVTRRGWEPWGCLGPVHWLSWQCGLGEVAASEHIRVATALRGLPAITTSLATGEITWSKVRAITRVATPTSEATWLNVARTAPAATVEALVRAHRRVTADDVDAQEASRSLTWRQEPNGSVLFHLRLPAETAAAIVAAVQDATTPEVGVPIAARRADTITELILGPTLPTPTVLILTTAQALGGGDGPCTTDHGIAVDPAVAATAACNGPIISASPSQADVPDFPRETAERPAAADATSDLRRETADRPAANADQPADTTTTDFPRETPTTVRPGEENGRRWRQHRYPTTSTRWALLARDRTCRFPGCHRTGQLDAHHLIHWIHGGPRHQTNLVLLCPGHHRLVHRRQLTLRLAPDGTVTAWQADGTPLHQPVIPERGNPPHPTGQPVPDWDGKRIDFAFAVACLATTG